jgi:phosphoglycerol transferase MdoB-like AlkP superfamily enzyme
MKISLKRMFLLWTLLFLSIVYFEIVFKISLLIVNFNDEMVFVLGFSFVYSLFILFFLLFFKPLTIKRFVFVIILALTFIFLMQDVYHTVVENFYSIQIAGDFSLGLSFIGDAFLALRFRHIFYIIPLIFLIIINIKFKNFYDADYMFLKQPLIILSLSMITFFFVQNLINDNRIEDGITIMFTDKDLYDYVYDTQLTVKSFGLITYVYRDIVNVFKTEPLRETEYNVLIEDFLSNRPTHEENMYSGALSGKNLILIMAESFDTYAIHPDLTPTLYALKENHTSFTNYYSPLYYRSTADTEWMTQNSLYPNKNVTLTMEAYLENTLPNTLPNLFESIGYETFSYHNYIDYFYPRTEVHLNLFGYNTFKGAEALGLLSEVSDGSILFDHVWQRDLDLINLSVDDYLDQEHFFVNYVTVSGHFNYNDEHEVAQYHTEALQTYLNDNDLELPDDIFYYMATAMELDLAVETLMNHLSEANKLDDTVIMIYGDHYAYAINEQTIWDYDTIKTDGDAQDLHNVPMLMYAPNTLLAGEYDTYMSSLDIMPTIANLFDLPMFYQFAFGVDVFDETLHLVKFADMSYRSKSFNYDALTETYEFFDDLYTPADLFEMSQQIINDYRYNTLILDFDYFKK